MIRVVVALLSGLLFGAGLAISGMADPARVQGFLDLLGAWDPTLAFVMAGAMAPMAIAWLSRSRLERPFADARFDLPGTTKIDLSLASGALLFGAGWGVSGLCPGPAIANIAIAPMQVWPFLVAMFAGIALHRFTARKSGKGA
jgi:hypothetical protein